MKRAITLTITLTFLAALFLLRFHDNAAAQSWTTHFLATWDGATFENGPGEWVESSSPYWGSLDDWGAVTGAPGSYNGVPGNTYLAELSGDQALTSGDALPEANPGWTLPAGADWQSDADYAIEMAYAVGCGFGPCGGAERRRLRGVGLMTTGSLPATTGGSSATFDCVIITTH